MLFHHSLPHRIFEAQQLDIARILSLIDGEEFPLSGLLILALRRQKPGTNQEALFHRIPYRAPGPELYSAACRRLYPWTEGLPRHISEAYAAWQNRSLLYVTNRAVFESLNQLEALCDFGSWTAQSHKAFDGIATSLRRDASPTSDFSIYSNDYLFQHLVESALDCIHQSFR